MSTQIQAAVIAGIVGLLTASIGALLTFVQARRERSNWLVDFKSNYALELYRQRLAVYPAAFKIIGRLSHGADPKPDASIVGQVAVELNDWIYSAGGLCADAGTRGALLGLRIRCSAWPSAGDSGRPEVLYDWRNVALAMLRLDIDVTGLEEYDFGNMPSALERLRNDVSRMVDERPRPDLVLSHQSSGGKLCRPDSSTQDMPATLGKSDSKPIVESCVAFGCGGAYGTLSQLAIGLVRVASSGPN